MFFDISEEAEPRVLQMSAAKRQPDLFSRGLTEALATIGEGDSQARLRLFQVPALNIEALWLSYEGEGQDMLIPLHTVGRLAQYNPAPLSEAWTRYGKPLVHWLIWMIRWESEIGCERMRIQRQAV